MLKIDALVDLFFTEDELAARVAKIADCGYNYIETWKGGDATELKVMADAGKNCGVDLVSIVMNFATDAAVAPINPDNKKAFVERMDEYSDNALAAGCMQGIVTTGQSLGGKNYQEQRAALVNALREAGELVAKKNFKLNLEMLNTEVDHSGYFLDTASDGVAIVKEVALDNVKVLYDVYHMGIMGGNLTVFIENNIEWIGHFHSAGIPGRHELFNGETNYPFITEKIEKAGYDAYFGLEYMPLLESKETLTKTMELFR
ncbi:MAG: TIM barrel protein [Victivallales bacterium]|nr:TIM barrel protein [Victivallales bacterium]